MIRRAFAALLLLSALTEASPSSDVVAEHQAVVVPRRSVQLSAAREGMLSEVHVVLGQRVARGEPIATLESETVRLERAAAAASLREAHGEFELARITFEKAGYRLQRIMTSPEAFSESERRDAEFDKQLAEEQKRIAQTRIERNEVTLARLDELLRRSVVEAPFDGTVARVHRGAGAVVGSGTPIVHLITTADLLVRFAVPPDVASRLQPGDRVVFHGGRLEPVCDALIEHISAEIDPALQQVIVEAQLVFIQGDRPDRVQPGKVGHVRLEVPGRP